MVTVARKKGGPHGWSLSHYNQVWCVCVGAELQRAKEMIQKEKQRRQRDKMVTDSLREWQRVLPNWDNM